MNDFNYQENRLHCEDYPLDNLASTFGTPCFVYSASAMTAAYKTIQSAFEYHNPLICYAVKANSNLAVLKRLCDLAEQGWTSRKKVPFGIRLKSTRPSHGRVLPKLHPPEARQNFLLAGLYD